MNIKVKQRDITDCGAACLASVAAFYKLQLPVSKIRQYASTDKKGTNILGLIEAATKMGFSAKGVRGEFDALYDIPKPSIAHVIVNKVLHHYVVIYKVTKNAVEVMDPGDGRVHKYTHDKFKEMWTGVLVILMPNDEFRAMSETVSISKRFWYLIKPHKSIMVQSLLGRSYIHFWGYPPPYMSRKLWIMFSSVGIPICLT